LAVVSAAAASADALIEDGRTGILCPPDDIDAYGWAILALVENPESRREMGAAARQASERFSWTNASRQAADAYRIVLPPA
jgi:glycosyltransferase involved in cell wall biosynthesis